MRASGGTGPTTSPSVATTAAEPASAVPLRRREGLPEVVGRARPGRSPPRRAVAALPAAPGRAGRAGTVPPSSGCRSRTGVDPLRGGVECVTSDTRRHYRSVNGAHEGAAVVGGVEPELRRRARIREDHGDAPIA